jgi:hypothetical protein
MPQPLLRSTLDSEQPPNAMSHHLFHHDRTAAPGVCCAGATWLGSGCAIGLVVVDSNRPPMRGTAGANRPAIGAGSARGLLKQFVAAH